MYDVLKNNSSFLEYPHKRAHGLVVSEHVTGTIMDKAKQAQSETQHSRERNIEKRDSANIDQTITKTPVALHSSFDSTGINPPIFDVAESHRNKLRNRVGAGKIRSNSRSRKRVQDSSQRNQPHQTTEFLVPAPVASNNGCKSFSEMTILEKRVTFVKCYAFMKDQMGGSDTMAIAERLFTTDQDLISNISFAQRRRQKVEILLKKVLESSDKLFEDFIRDLEEIKAGSVFVTKLEGMLASPADVEVYSNLNQERSFHKKDGPDPTLTFSEEALVTLKENLDCSETIEKINDELFSRLISSINQHTAVVKGFNQKKELLHAVQSCALWRFKDFIEILTSVGLKDVAKNLDINKKRKLCYLSESESESTQSGKRQCLSKKALIAAVKSSTKPDSAVNSQAPKLLGFKIDQINKGSIVIQMRPTGPESWQKLKESCQTGKIKDFIPELFKNEDVYKQLREGEFTLQITLFSVPMEPTTELKRALLVVDEEEEWKDKPRYTNKDKNLIDKCEDILKEELEIGDELLSLLSSKGLVDEEFVKEIKELELRTEQVSYLLQKIRQHDHGKTGFQIIKTFAEVHNEYLYKMLVLTTKSVPEVDSAVNALQTGTGDKSCKVQHTDTTKKVLFFECTLKLLVKYYERETQSHGKDIEITCPRIIRSTCHFEEAENKKPCDGLLTDTWGYDRVIPEGHVRKDKDTTRVKRKPSMEKGLTGKKVSKETT